jgi:hypothetical protein
MQEAWMASRTGGPKLIQVFGDSAALVDRLREPLLEALSRRRGCYAVRVDTVGPMGEVLVSITGSQGRIPLLFGREELEVGHVSSVVRGAVDGSWTAPPPGQRATGLGSST